MARPDILRGTYVTILMGDGASTEVFSVLCGITAKSLVDQVNTSDTFTRDCALPDDVPTRNIITTGRQWDISGSGQLNRTQSAALDTAVGKYKNFRFFIARKTSEVAPAGLNGYYGGSGVITRRTIDGGDDGNVGVDLTIASDGPWVWTPITT